MDAVDFTSYTATGISGSRSFRMGFLIILVAVGFLLLVAWHHVANCCSARVTARQKEFAIRAVLGQRRYSGSDRPAPS